jgi:hypothetical protein
LVAAGALLVDAVPVVESRGAALRGGGLGGAPSGDGIPGLAPVTLLRGGGTLSRALRAAARCASRKANTARAASPLVSKPPPAAMRPAPVRSRSAINAPRGSEAMAAIDPARGPRPNRCNAIVASTLGSRAMREHFPPVERHGCDGIIRQIVCE